MAERLKDRFFTPVSMEAFAGSIAAASSAFDRECFLRLVFDEEWDRRELKDRMRHTTRCLRAALPLPYAESLEVLKRAIPSIKGFEAMTAADFVEQYGQDEWALSLGALRFFTRYGSAEFAVRPFLHRDPERGMAFLSECAADENEQVRRLASEGCRPRLPWAMGLPRFKKDPQPILPVLEKLKNDPSETVRRSVANNLNDISKDHPEAALAVCERWYGTSERTDRIVKHACRGLLKAGHPRAMRLFGFEDSDDVTVEGFRVESGQVPLGGDLVFGFALRIGGAAERRIRLEYAVWFVKATGRRSRKMFTCSERSYPPGVYPIRKRHPFADMSTRKHYRGEHEVILYANGKERGRGVFEVV